MMDRLDREFRDAIKLRYDWPVHIPSTCACGKIVGVNHAVICKRDRCVFQQHNELRVMKVELLNMVCSHQWRIVK